MSFANFRLRLSIVALLFATAPLFTFGQGAPMANPPPRAEELRQLIATLQSKDSAHHDKVVACHRLAVIGTAEAVPALAALLTDEKLAHLARHALEPMPDPAAGTALRDALAKTQGPLLVGVINSLGVRRDLQASAALAALLNGTDDLVANAAAAALGRLGDAEAARKLLAALGHTKGARQLALADASLTCAEVLTTRGQRGAAAGIYDRLSAPEFPGYLRTAAMCGAITARQNDGIPLLVKQLQGSDPALLAAAWRAARELPGPGVTKALAAELAKMPAERQVQLLQVLGDRGDQAALSAVLDAAQRGAPGVRVAALQILPRVDDGRASQALLLRTVLGGSSPAEMEAALASLGQIGGADTNTRILAALPTAAPATRAKLIGVLGARRADEARSDLLKLAASTEPEVSKAAFRALAQVAVAADLPELIRLSIVATDEAVKVPADLAVFAVSLKVVPAEKRADAVMQAYRAAPTAAARISLLRPLAAIVKATGGSHEILDTVKTAWADRDPALRDAALRSLADWPDARPAALLLEIFTQDPSPAHRELALRGGTRMAASAAAGRDPATLDFLAWFMSANAAVRTKEEKLIIVSGLGSLKQIEGLKLLEPYLSDPSVQTEAALALLEMAPALLKPPHGATVRALLAKVANASSDPDIRQKADKMAKGNPTKAKK